MGYRIGSFNMRNIGMSALGSDNARNLEKIAEIIRREEFDVVALQEVLSEGKALYSKGYAKTSILMELGPDWDFSWADAQTAGADRRHEGYAFVWNKNRLRLSSTKLDNGTERTFYPRICKIKHGDMFRKPYYARFTPMNTRNSHPVEIRLLCIHTYYGEKDNSLDREIRLRELDTLLTQIYPQISDRVYKDDVPSYTIVLGDYNAELYSTWHDKLARKKKPLYIDEVVVADKWDNMAIRTNQYELTTLKGSDTDEEGDESKMKRYSHNYDHFSYEDSPRLNEVILDCRRVDAIRKYEGDDAEKYKKEISDHLPVMLSMELG